MENGTKGNMDKHGLKTSISTINAHIIIKTAS